MEELSQIDRSTVARSLLKKVGIQKFLDMDGITEVAVNQGGTIFFERGNGWEYEDAPETNYKNLKALADTLTVFSGLHNTLDAKNPIASVVLPDGERGQIITAPATEANTISFTLRKPSKSRFTLEDYQNSGRFSKIKEAEAYQKGSIPDYMQEMKKCQKTGDYARFFKIAAEHYLNDCGRWYRFR